MHLIFQMRGKLILSNHKTMANKEQKLFAEFPPVSTEQWESVIAVDLKGADYEKKLVWRTAEGFNVRPYYRAMDCMASFW